MKWKEENVEGERKKINSVEWWIVRQSESVSGYCPPDPWTDWAGLDWTALLVWLVIDREKRMWAFLALLMAIIFKVRLFPICYF